MTKRLLSLTLALCLLSGCALADWYCPDENCANHTVALPDSTQNCPECGQEAPIHGFRVSIAGTDMLRLQWSGCMVGQVELFYSEAGSNKWQYIAATDKKSYTLAGLRSGTAYDLMLIDWNRNVITITGTTTADVTPIPAETSTPAPTATPVPTATPAPTATPGPTMRSGRFYYRVLGDGTV